MPTSSPACEVGCNQCDWSAVYRFGARLVSSLPPEKVLLALANAMDDFQNARVQAHAASAILNFSENCTLEILTPYLDGIVNKLLILLRNGKQMVQEGSTDSSSFSSRFISGALQEIL
ncbi:unnamed protein product [Urochloa humidicola]